MFSVSIVSTAAVADVTATVCGRGNSTAAVELPLAIEIYKTTAAVADVTEAYLGIYAAAIVFGQTPRPPHGRRTAAVRPPYGRRTAAARRPWNGPHIIIL